MSNYVKNGLRKFRLEQNKEVKKRIKGIESILEHLDEVAEEISEQETDTITEDNIVEIANNYTGLKIGGFEKLVLLSKLEKLGMIDEENITEDEEEGN